MAAKKKPAPKAAPTKTVAQGKKAVKPIPDGYRSITPYLSITGAAKAIDYYKKAFGARERFRLDAPGGKIGHAELEIGDSVVMLADEYPEMEFLSPRTRGGTSVGIHLYVRDCDAVFKRAVAAGGTVKQPLKDQFYGDRSGSLEDPFGHVWHVATHKEELTPAEIERRMKQKPA
jgi:PhnB protein